MSDKIIKYDDTVVYENGEWVDSAYQNIEVTGGDDAANTTLINTLAINAEGGITMPKTKTEALEALQKNPQEYASTIAGQLERIEDSKIVIVSKVNELGLNTESDITIDDAALAVNNIVLRNEDLTLDATKLSLPEGYYKGVDVILGDVSEEYELQERSVTPTKAEQIVQPEEGYWGLSKVTVEAIPAAYQDVTSVTATADKVLVGSKFVDANGQVIDGAMVNNGSVSKTLDVNNTSFAIAKGYHDGTGSVNVELEEKEINASDAINDVVIEPTEGSVLSKVTVKGCGEAQLTNNVLSFNKDLGVISASETVVSKGYSNGLSATAESIQLNVKTSNDIVLEQNADDKRFINVVVPTGYYQEEIGGQNVAENTKQIQLDTSELIASDITLEGSVVKYSAQVSEGWIADESVNKSVTLVDLDPNFVAENIAAGKTVLGVAGTFSADANATAAQILEGSSAYVNGTKVEGSMANLGSVATTVDALNSDATGMVIASVGNGYTTGGEIKLDSSIYNRLAAI